MGIFWTRFSKNPLAITGAVIVAILAVVALLAPWLAPYNPLAIDTYHILQPPCMAHWFGTDALGRDCLSRIIYGARISLLVGLVAVGLSTAVGTVLGAVAGYFGGWIDSLVMRLVDVMLCFPTIFLIMAVIAFLQPSITNIMVVIGLTSWMGVARLVRAEFLSLRQRDFVKAAYLLGMPPYKIIFSEILPNAVAPILVSATLGVGAAILTESALSFLGIGVQPPTPSWGNMLTAGKDNLEIAWWLSVFPGMAILITVLGFNLLGEGLRDALDPRLQIKLKASARKKQKAVTTMACLFLLIISAMAFSTPAKAAEQGSGISQEMAIIARNCANDTISVQKIPGSEIKIGPQEVAPAWQLIWNHARQMGRAGQIQAAIALYQELLIQRPGLIQAKWELAQLFAKAGEKTRAVNLIEQYLESRPQDGKAKLLLADLLVELGQYRRAERLYRALLTQASSNKKNANCPSRFTVELRLAGVMSILKDFQGCVSHLMAAWHLKPGDKSVALQLAYCLQQCGEDKKALNYFQYVEQFNRQDPVFLKHFAQCLIDNGKLPDAAKVLSDLLRNMDNSSPDQKRWAQRQLIRIYLMDDNETAAIKALETWLSQSRDDFLERRLARLYFANQEYLKALNAFDSLLDLYPNDPECLGFIARIYCIFRMYSPAITTYKRLLSVAPSERVRYRLVKLLSMTGRYKDCLSLLTGETVAHFMASETGEFWLARIYFKADRIKEAEGLLKDLVERYPYNTKYLRWLTLAYLKQYRNRPELSDTEADYLTDIAIHLADVGYCGPLVRQILNLFHNSQPKSYIRLLHTLWNRFHQAWMANALVRIYRRNNHCDSIGSAKNFLRQVPNDIWLRISVCRCLARLGKINSLRALLSKTPARSNYWSNDITLIKANALSVSGYFSKAFPLLNQVLSREPCNLYARTTLMTLYTEAGMTPDAQAQARGISMIWGRVPEMPMNGTMLNIFGTRLPSPSMALKKPDVLKDVKISRIVSLLKRYGPNEGLSFLLILSYVRDGMISEANTSLNMFVRTYPENLRAVLLYARLLKKSGQKELSKKLLKNTLVMLRKIEDNGMSRKMKDIFSKPLYTKRYVFFIHSHSLWYYLKTVTYNIWSKRFIKLLTA